MYGSAPIIGHNQDIIGEMRRMVSMNVVDDQTGFIFSNAAAHRVADMLYATGFAMNIEAALFLRKHIKRYDLVHFVLDHHRAAFFFASLEYGHRCILEALTDTKDHPFL